MKRWIVPIIFIVALSSLVVWRLGVNAKATAASNKERTTRKNSRPSVNIAVVGYHDIIHTFDGVGNVESPLSVKIAPQLAGQVIYVAGQEGDRVTKGEVLLRMDPSAAQADVAQQEANVAQAQQHLAQAQLTQSYNDVGVQSAITQARAALRGAYNVLGDATKTYNDQVRSAELTVDDDKAKVASAEAQVTNGVAGVQSAQANLVDAQAKFNREDALFKKGYVAAQDKDDATAALGVAQANVDVAKGQLNADQAGLNSAKAELNSAEHQVKIIKVTGIGAIKAGQSQVEESVAALKTAKSNIGQQPAYEANLRALRAAVVAAQAQLNSAKVELAYTVVTSPIDGFIVSRLMDPGAQATAGSAVLQVQLTKQVWVTVPVPEENADNVHLGQEAKVTFDALPNRAFSAIVSQINQSADPSSRDYSVRVTLSNPGNVVKPGMFGQVGFVTGRENHVLYVPREAVHIATDGSASVIALDDKNDANVRQVTIETSDVGGYALSKGVSEGDRVVTMSAQTLKDGQAVKPPSTGDASSSGAGGKAGHHKHNSATAANPASA